MKALCDIFSVPSLHAVDYHVEEKPLESYQADAYRFWISDREGFAMEEIRTRSTGHPGWNLQISRREVVRSIRNNFNRGDSDALQMQLQYMLEHKNIILLERHRYGLYTMAMMSRYIDKNYPYVYWLVLLLDPRWSPAEGSTAITREMLAKALGVGHLSHGQMKAMRKVQVEKSYIRDVQTAILMIARQWDLLEPLVAHEAWIDPREMVQLAMILKLSPELKKTRWFGLKYVYEWGCRFEVGCHPSIYFKYALVVSNSAAITSKRDFHRLNEDFKRTLSSVVINEEEPAASRSALKASLVEGGSGMVDLFPVEVRQDWEKRWRAIVNDFLMDMDDQEYNRQENSDFFMDDEKFPSLSGLVQDEFFSRVISAGQLRNIAWHLENCAASRVHLGVNKEAEFWLYNDDLNHEQALLQVNVCAVQDDKLMLSIVEFNGYKNNGVTPLANERLYAWQQAQARLCSHVRWVS